MTKQQMLDSIENAKQMHTAQMTKIESVIDGKEVTEPTPLSKKECSCGVWFYTNEATMREVLGAQLFEKLDLSHTRWHEDYAKIYEIFFKEEKRGFFSKLIGSSKIDEMDIDKAKLYFEELKTDTKELFQISDVATRRVHALSDTKFD